MALFRSAFDSVWSEAAYSVVQNYMQGGHDAKPYQKTLGSRKCTALPDIFMMRIFHRTRKLLACENKTLLQWKIEIDLFAQGRPQRNIFPRKEPSECSIDQ